MRSMPRFLYVFLVTALLGSCSELTKDDVTGTYVNNGLAYESRLQFFADGTYQHFVYQSLGNSVSSRENKWTHSTDGEGLEIQLQGFKSVVTIKDFAAHRSWGSHYKTMVIEVERGFFGAVILRTQEDVPVEFLRLD